MSMVGYADQFVQLYLEITGVDPKSLRKVPTPHINDSTLADRFVRTTRIHETTCIKGADEGSLVGKDFCRPDISFSVGRLASRITVWSRAEDVHLHRLVAYVHWTREYKNDMSSWHT